MKGLALFGRALRERPFGASAGLILEYAGFFAASVFVLLLVLTRAPLRVVDRVFGLRLRERFIDLVARASPG